MSPELMLNYVSCPQNSAELSSKKSSSDPAETVASAITWQPLSTLLATLTHGNGLALAKSYTQDYEVSRCEVTDGALPVIDLSYARSDLINITAITDNVTAANSATFGYAAANRLSTAAGPWGGQGWAYDGVGNRTSETATPPGGSATTDTYAYASTSNRIETVTRGAQTVRLFAYDAAGNIVSDARSGSTYAYTYNAAGRLKTVSYEGNLKGTYVYNGLEQLITRVITNSGTLDGTIHTVHDRSGNVIAEIDAAGQTVREYVWLPEGGYAGTDPGSGSGAGLPLAVVDGVNTASPVTYHVHADHLGRPIRMTDATKAAVWQATWQPWGAPQSITGSLVLNHRFPGQWFQLESGLHYNWHRHYDPSLGRYTQPDPLGFVDGPAVFAYASGNPLEFVDFLGLSPETPSGPVIIDPRTGQQVYPPPQSGPTRPGTLQPPPLPPIPPKPTCEGFLQACMVKCTKYPLCKAHKAVDLACRAACLAGYYFCKKKSGD
ncbi:MAG: RHS repeat-associated core domain-containing protein [Pseudomonadota bacterium]